eukprot:TRINITY_DN2474_c1_g1_i1.p1 TRINITY_DN2474_c1_g1~~TRINITY_DN2474_c1_g1_i1.p1  ORF type:complete len:252 (+),score=35.30 TRINITY_DN2474_c1_g1_i1:66-821(+)
MCTSAQKVARVKFREGLKALEPCNKALKEKEHQKPAPGDLFASKVLPWLYLGAAYDANREEEIKRMKITHILNLQHETICCKWDGVDYLDIQVSDHSDSPISSHFAKLIEWLESVRKANGIALVHCRQGISRSATVTIAYLMQMLSIPYALAHDVVKRRRPVINPNIGFVDALKVFETTLDIKTLPMPCYHATLQEWELTSPLTEGGALVEEQPTDNADSPGTPPSPKRATSTLHSTSFDAKPSFGGSDPS